MGKTKAAKQPKPTTASKKTTTTKPPEVNGVDLSKIVVSPKAKTSTMPRMSNAARGLMKAKKERIEELEIQEEWNDALQTEKRITAYQRRKTTDHDAAKLDVQEARKSATKQPRLPALTHTKQCVLRGVEDAANRSGGGRVLQKAILDRIEPFLNGRDAPGEKVAKATLIELESDELIDRKDGPRKGYALTEKGKEACQEMADFLSKAKPKPAR